jgi:hypothetical protein
VDDFWSGSRAAIAGGITTIGNMTYPGPAGEDAEETPGAAITARPGDGEWLRRPVAGRSSLR